jgi:O-antigen ligase
MVNPSSYGGLVACVALIQFCLLLGKSNVVRLPRWLQWLNLCLLGTADIMTLSRSSIVGLMLGLVASLYFYRARASLKIIGVAMIAALIVGSVVFWYASSSTGAEFQGYAVNKVTIEQRMSMNSFALGMLLDSPINVALGVGVGTFLVRSGEVFATSVMIHNTFIWIIVELGIVGFAFLAGIIVVSFRNCLKVAWSKTPDAAIAAGVVCALVSCLGWFLGTEGLWHRHVWFLFILSEAVYRVCIARQPVRIKHQLRGNGVPVYGPVV